MTDDAPAPQPFTQLALALRCYAVLDYAGPRCFDSRAHAKLALVTYRLLDLLALLR